MYGQYRQKHKLRFIFRTVSFVVLVGGYTFYNTYWPNNDTSAAVGVIGGIGGGGQVSSNSNDLGGESLLLRRRLSSDSTARHDGGNVIWNGKFITYIIVYIIL